MYLFRKGFIFFTDKNSAWSHSFSSLLLWRVERIRESGTVCVNWTSLPWPLPDQHIGFIEGRNNHEFSFFKFCMQKERSVLEVYLHSGLLPENTVILLSFPCRRVLCWTGQAGDHSLLQISADLDKYRKAVTVEWLPQWLKFVSWSLDDN